jgi:hypothetical protein
MVLETKFLGSLGKVAGPAGIALGILLLIFRGILQTEFLPHAGLKPQQAIAVILALLILTFGIAVIGMVAWLVSHTGNSKAPISAPALTTLATSIALVLGAAVYVGVQAFTEVPNPGAGSVQNSITNVPSNKGIVTQEQTGNNFIVPFPAPEPGSARRNVLIGKLRQEYIFSHDGLSPALLAGTEPVPADWMNKRLAQMGELWRVRAKGSEYEILLPNNP